MIPIRALVPVLACGCVSACHAQPAMDSSASARSGGDHDAGAVAWGAMHPLDTAPVAFPQYPSISPDGTSIVFAHAGDLWSVPAAGGVAARLSAHPSDEGRSAFSPDGSLLAFESERDGPRNIYVMPVTSAGAGVLVGGTVRRVTVSDRGQSLSGFAADGRSVLFASMHEPSIHRATRMYRAAVAGPEGGGSIMQRVSDAFGGGPRETPDGSALLFHRGRHDPTRTKYTGSAATDVYRLDLGSGRFTRVTADPRLDGDAFGLPDGSIVFVSSRDGENNIWRLGPGETDAGGGPRQLTRFSPSPGEVTIGHGVRDLSVAPGGWTAVFCVWDTIYTLDLKAPGAEPRPVSVAAGADFALLDFQRMNLSRQVTDAALSPDGKTVAVVARGEVFIRSTEKDRPTRRVTGSGSAGAARARDVAWSPDGRLLYFVSDTSGVSGIYAATVALAREDLATEEQPERVPEVVPDEPPPAPGPDPAAPVDPPSPPEPPSDADDPQPEPEAEKPEGAPSPRPAPKKPDHGKRWSEAITFSIAPVAVGELEQRRPVPSPDGKRLLFTRALGDLVMIDAPPARGGKAAGPERTVLKSWNDADAVWAPDSRHIIYRVADVNFNSDIWLVDALAEAGSDGAGPVNITRHPDNDHAPRLSADGKVLYFLSDRDANVNGQDDVFAVNLDRKLDGLRPYELADYFKDAAEKARKRRPLGAAASARPRAGAAASSETEAKPDEPAEKKTPAPSPDRPLAFDAADAYLRIRRIVATSGDVGGLEITPAGDRVLFTGSVEGTSALFSVDSGGKDRKTVFAGPASGLSMSLTGDKVLFISSGPAPRDTEDRPVRQRGGEAHTAKPTGGDTEKLSIDAPVTVDIAAQQRQKFLEASRLMGDRFYHPTLKGLDWSGLTQRYLSLAVRTRTDSEFNRVFGNMLGELEGSHMGISGGRETAGSGQPIGYLGVDVAAVPGGFRITRIVANSPADAKPTRLEVGEVIVSVGTRPVAAADDVPVADLNAAMAGTSGQETLLELRGKEGGARRFVLITPVSSATDSALRYQDEVRRRAAMVDQLSGGKLGYLHIRAMNMDSVRDYERDVFAAAEGKAGLVIDVRDNGGGSTTDILLASLTAPRHAYVANRGVDLASLPRDAYPRDRRLIYGYSRPISVLINQHSYSNAEIFAHAIRTIGRGTLVGVPTFGAVISTGAASLIDGTTIRTPFRGWYLPDGTDMENNGAEPHIPVPQTPEDEVAGQDRQLEAAVQDLLKRAAAP